MAKDIDNTFRIQDRDIVLVDSSTEILQRIKNRLATRMGEFFLDTQLGVDWQKTISLTTRNVPPAVTEMEIRRVIGQDGAVKSIENLEIVGNGRTRNISFTVVLQDGSILDSEVTSMGFNQGFTPGGVSDFNNGFIPSSDQFAGFENALFHLTGINDEQAVDRIGEYFAPDDFVWQGLAIETQGVESYDFNSANDGANFWYYDLGADQEVQATYNHATKWTPVAGIEIAYARFDPTGLRSQGSVYFFEERNGATIYDVINQLHGEILNATEPQLTAIRAARTLQKSYIQQNGFNEVNGVYIPAQDGQFGVDVLGNQLQYIGRIKFNADFVNSNCVSATTSSTLNFATELTSADSITNGGTATVSLSTTGITVTADGTLFNVVINGELYPFAEGIGTVAYGETNSINMTGITWSEQDEYHYNIVNGFDAYENTLGERLFVPIGSTVNQAGYAFFDTFIQDGKSLLPCETDIVFPQAPALIQADVDNVLFDVTGTPLEIDWEDVINATAEQEVIGIELTVGTDGQGQVVVPGLTVAYQEYTADVPNGGTLVFSSISGDDYYDSLNNVIVVGTGSNVTLTNNTGDTADMGVIHMDGQLEGKTVAQMLALVQTMDAGTDLQHLKNPDVTSTHSDTIQKSIMSIRGTGGADWIGRSLPNGVSDLSYIYFRKNVQNVKRYVLQTSDITGIFPLVNVDLILIPTSTFVGNANGGVSDNIAEDIDTSRTNPKDGVLPTDQTENYWKHDYSGTNFRIIVPHNQYASLAEAQADLAGTIINYQLATPIITDADITIVDENGNPQDYWHLYENGQISGEAEDLLPIVKYKNLQESQPLRTDYNLPLGRKYNLAGFVTEGTFAFEFSFDF